MIDPADGMTRVVNLTIKNVGYRSLSPKSIADADAVLFCFDITDQESFFSLSKIF